MFESLTAFLPKLQEGNFGDWAEPSKDSGLQLGVVDYSEDVGSFVQAVYAFADEHEKMDLFSYRDILDDAKIAWELDSMKEADVSALGGKTVTALIVAAIRAEQFCDGALLDFLQEGCIAKWLARLKEIDRERD